MLAVAATVAITGAAGAVAEQKNPLTESPTWNMLRDVIIGDVVPEDGADVISLSAPYRAQDGAMVPIELKQVGDESIRSLKLVVDENPAPVAASIEFGEAMQPLSFATNLRVDQYSNVRAVAETENGAYMTGAFVKASGGCSAPSSSDAAAALAAMGDMHLLQLGGPGAGRHQAEVTIQHPNYSGLQRDHVTQLFVPPHFIDYVEVKQGDDLLFRLEGGISIAENPVFRFDYTDNGAPDITIEAHDTEGNVFRQVIAKPAAS